MSAWDAMSPQNLLAFETNGEPLPQPNGFPLRPIAPGRYDIADVKWLKRIEVRPSRYMGHFMAREYVTIRQEDRDPARSHRPVKKHDHDLARRHDEIEAGQVPASYWCAARSRLRPAPRIAPKRATRWWTTF